ncbi:MAG TPA: hypothetical protein VEH28_04920 [Thermoplasmata archaeon]|nr:hypothetical protein [Thermoplasmata archaeon]
MSTGMAPLAIDPGLLARFRAAGEKIAWRTVGTKRATGPKARIAHLNDEEARVELGGRGAKVRLTVDSGPLGALVLLLEIDRRGPPTGLGASEAGREPRFPSGAIVAAWDGEAVPEDSKPTGRDLVDLARYSLA